MVRLLKGAAKPMMPPKDEPRPGADEIAVIEAWIESGARGPQGQEPDRLALVVPKVPAHAKVRPIVAMDATRDGRWLAVARGAEVGLYSGARVPRSAAGAHARPLPRQGHRLAFHARRPAPGHGLGRRGPGRRRGDLERRRRRARPAVSRATATFSTTRSSRPTANGSPPAATTRKSSSGTRSPASPCARWKGTPERSTMSAFSPDSRFLVSASADDTCKVWRVADGQRMDTLPQPLKAEYTCTFSPDGRTIVAAGADNNIRVWRFVSRDKPEINPMVIARFAHEGAIVRLAFTPDGTKLVSLAEDRTIKVWRTSDYSELKLWENQPDVASALAFAADGVSFEVGRMDGSLASYTIPAAEPVVSHSRPGSG